MGLTVICVFISILIVPTSSVTSPATSSEEAGREDMAALEREFEDIINVAGNLNTEVNALEEEAESSRKFEKSFRDLLEGEIEGNGDEEQPHRTVLQMTLARADYTSGERSIVVEYKSRSNPVISITDFPQTGLTAKNYTNEYYDGWGYFKSICTGNDWIVQIVDHEISAQVVIQGFLPEEIPFTRIFIETDKDKIIFEDGKSAQLLIRICKACTYQDISFLVPSRTKAYELDRFWSGNVDHSKVIKVIERVEYKDYFEDTLVINPDKNDYSGVLRISVMPLRDQVGIVVPYFLCKTIPVLEDHGGDVFPNDFMAFFGVSDTIYCSHGDASCRFLTAMVANKPRGITVMKVGDDGSRRKIQSVVFKNSYLVWAYSDIRNVQMYDRGKYVIVGTNEDGRVVEKTIIVYVY